MVTKSRYVWLLGVGAAIGLALSPAAGALADKPDDKPDNKSEKQAAPGADLPWQDARTLADVLERVKHDYVNPVDDHQLQIGRAHV